MATETEQLVVQLEARIRDFERSFQRANRTAQTNWSQIEKRGETAAKRLASIQGTIGTTLGTLGIGVGTASSLRAVSAAARQFTDLQNALKVTGLEGEKLDSTFSSLFQIAQRNGTAIEPLVTLYSRAAQAQKELNASSTDLLKFTDGVSTALRVAGTNSTQAAGALLQLSQAIGGGIVRAEEFNSVNEGARPILQAVAAGLEEAGGSVSKLKTLVNDGKVSSEAFFRAFLAGMPQIEAQAAKASGTIGQANERIGNAFILLVGHLDKATGASANAASNLSALGGVLEKLPSYFDQASGNLQTFQTYLTQLGNSPVWMKIAKFIGADMSPEGLRAAGLMEVHPPSSGGGRIAEGARDPLGRAPAPATIKPVSLRNFKLPGDGDADGKSLDAFQRSTSMIEKRIQLLNSEASTMDQGTAARERARVVIELESAARRANEQAGLKNKDVTAEQRLEIERLADAYAKAAVNVENLNSPLARLARSSQDVKAQFQELAVSSLGTLENELVDVITGTQSVADAFKNMANAIIADLARIAIRQTIIAPLAGALSGSSGGLIGFASGGEVHGPGTSRSDSIVARLSDGEFVVNARATAQHRELLHAINSGRIARFADGGPVGTLAPAPASGGPAVVNQITINATGGTAEQNNDVAAQIAKQFEGVLERQMRQITAEEIRRQIRPGGILR